MKYFDNNNKYSLLYFTDSDSDNEKNENIIRYDKHTLKKLNKKIIYCIKKEYNFNKKKNNNNYNKNISIIEKIKILENKINNINPKIRTYDKSLILMKK